MRDLLFGLAFALVLLLASCTSTQPGNNTPTVPSMTATTNTITATPEPPTPSAVPPTPTLAANQQAAEPTATMTILSVVAQEPTATVTLTPSPATATSTAIPPPPATATAMAEPTSTVAPQVSSRCEEVPEIVVTTIASRLNGGTSLKNAKAVKSSDFTSVYFVSALIIGPGIQEGTALGTWATNRLDGTGIILTADSFAKEFSDWPEGSKTDARIAMSQDGARPSQACVRGR